MYQPLNSSQGYYPPPQSFPVTTKTSVNGAQNMPYQVAPDNQSQVMPKAPETSYITHRKNINPERYDGVTDWEEYIVFFEEVSRWMDGMIQIRLYS